MSAKPTTTCPKCGRIVSVRTNRFGDMIYARHRMATLNNAGPRTDEIVAEFSWNAANPDATPIWEIDCPNSGQPI